MSASFIALVVQFSELANNNGRVNNIDRKVVHATIATEGKAQIDKVKAGN